MELGDTPVLGIGGAIRTGSTPVLGTNINIFFIKAMIPLVFVEFGLNFFQYIFLDFTLEKYISFYFFGGWHYPAAFVDILWLGFVKKWYFYVLIYKYQIYIFAGSTPAMSLFYRFFLR